MAKQLIQSTAIYPKKEDYDKCKKALMFELTNLENKILKTGVNYPKLKALKKQIEEAINEAEKNINIKIAEDAKKYKLGN